MACVHPLPPLPDEIAAYLADLVREGKSPVTIAGYKHDLLDFVRFYQQEYSEPFCAAACTARELADYKSHLRVTRRLGAATVNRRLAALRGLFRWAHGTGLVAELPTERIKRVKATRPPPKSLERKEQNRLMREVERARKPRDIAIITLLLGTGLRVAELCDLRLADITMGKVRGSLKVVSGKGDKERTITLNADVCAALRAYYAVRPRSADDHVFLGHTGKGLTHDGLQYLVKAYGQRAGLEGLHPHVLRHCFARNLLAKGVDIATVSRLLGHENINATMIYVEPSQEDLDQAVCRLEEEW